MSKFNSYAREADKIARAAFQEIKEKAEALKAAEAKKNEYPEKYNTPVSSEYLRESSKAAIAYAEAKEDYDKMTRTLPLKAAEQIKEIKTRLESALSAEFRADPNRIDTNLLELLKSGIMTADEYEQQLNKAKAANNTTMIRLIGKYADAAEENIAIKYGKTDNRAVKLRYVASESTKSDSERYLNNFNLIEECTRRCINNPYMIPNYDDLVGDLIEAF